jgi:hypothetical protein
MLIIMNNSNSSTIWSTQDITDAQINLHSQWYEPLGRIAFAKCRIESTGNGVFAYKTNIAIKSTLL